MTHHPRQGARGAVQSVGTPRNLLDAVQNRFGTIEFDLAADEGNCVARNFFDKTNDALAQDWTLLHGNLWLNPPFRRIRPWAEKCMRSFDPARRRIFLLTPLSSASWATDYVFGFAAVYLLAGRVIFEGHTTAFPKDLMISVFGLKPTIEVWHWRKEAS